MKPARIYVPPVILDGPHRPDRAGWLLVFVILASALASGLLEREPDFVIVDVAPCSFEGGLD